MSPVPKSYAEWEHCITVKCGLDLTADFVAARIEALENPQDYHTRKFLQTWGEAHHAQVLRWFKEAAERLDR